MISSSTYLDAMSETHHKFTDVDISAIKRLVSLGNIENIDGDQYCVEVGKSLIESFLRIHGSRYGNPVPKKTMLSQKNAYALVLGQKLSGKGMKSINRLNISLRRLCTEKSYAILSKLFSSCEYYVNGKFTAGSFKKALNDVDR